VETRAVEKLAGNTTVANSKVNVNRTNDEKLSNIRSDMYRAETVHVEFAPKPNDVR
jgi:hypothetical protein